MKRPPLGLCLPCKVVRVRDGDTVEVTLVSGARWAVRLIDCWCEELRRGSPEQRARGEAAKEFAQQSIDEARQLHLFVPAPDDVAKIVSEGGGGAFAHLFTFDRVLGHLFVADDTTLSELMVRAGHATKSKPEALDARASSTEADDAA